MAPGADTVLLDSTAPLISPVFPNSVFEQATITLRPGQSLLLYTDGIVDAQADSQEFGLPGILSRVPRQSDGDGTQGAMLDAILAAVRAHLGHRPAADDMTLLAARPSGERRKTAG